MTDKWNGQGLPPVGDEFEWSLNGACYEEGVMLFNDGVTMLIAHRKYPANRRHLKTCDPALRFRPLKSEAERKLDEALDEMEQHLIGKQLDYGSLCQALYDAGYRKVNKLTDEQIADMADSLPEKVSPQFCTGVMYGISMAVNHFLGEES